MKVGIPKEASAGETRVAVIPAGAATLAKAGLQVAVETGAGVAAGFPDAAYAAQGADDRSRAPTRSHRPTSCCRSAPSPAHGQRPATPGQTVIGFADPLGSPQAIRDVAATGATLLSMELMPRITRAQSMDALSSMATIAGYKGVLLAANHLPRMFPMLMTAAGTVAPARVFIVGAGVAGLQAISSARRLGAKVEAYDVRPGGQGTGAEPRRQVRRAAARVGGRRRQGRLRQGAGRIVLPPPARDDDQGRRRERRRDHDRADSRQARADPHHHRDGRGDAAGIGRRRSGRRARRQLRADAARRDRRPQRRARSSVRRIRPALVPYHASQMYSKNIITFLLHLLGKDGAKQATLALDPERRDHARDAADQRTAPSCMRASRSCSAPEPRRRSICQCG